MVLQGKEIEAAVCSVGAMNGWAQGCTSVRFATFVVVDFSGKDCDYSLFKRSSALHKVFG